MNEIYDMYNQPFKKEKLGKTLRLISKNLSINYERNETFGKIENEITITKNNIRHGPSKIFRHDNSLMHEYNFNKGTLDGLQKSYYPNGMLVSEINLINGTIEGIERIYFADGRLKSERTYRNGLLHGLQIIYNKNGSISEILNYKNGTLYGTCKTYLNNGCKKIYYRSDQSIITENSNLVR